jgi:pilus assembly protein CpaE
MLTLPHAGRHEDDAGRSRPADDLAGRSPVHGHDREGAGRMYPFPVVLVGIDGADLPALRNQLTHLAADIESEFTTLGAAAECLRRSRKQARLFVVQVGPGCDADAIARLSDDFSTWPILALVPRTDALREILAVNRAGASQVVTLPLDRDDFRRAVTMLGTQFHRGLLDRHVFAVAGAVGGSGTSMIAINLAYEIAQKFRRSTILAEFTLQVGALASLLDIHPRITLGHLLHQINRVDDLMVEKSLVPVGDGLKVLAGAHEVGPPPSVEPGHFARLVGCFKKLADVSVLDIPDLFHGPAATVLDTADRVLLVGVQSISSIRSLKLFCEKLPEERLHHAVWVAINRYDPQMKGFSVAEIKKILGVPHVMTVTNDFRAVSMAHNQGKPLRQVMPGTPIIGDIDALAHSLLGLERHRSHRHVHLFSRVFGALKRQGPIPARGSF